MEDIVKLLLGLEGQKLPEKRFKVKRLTALCGADVIFTLKALPYNRVAEIKESTSGDLSIEIILAGMVSPDLRDKALLEKHHAPTPAELVKTLLLPGEIEDIAREIEKLSGYRTATISEVKKNEKMTPD